MRTSSIRGKLTQLSNLPASKWLPFIQSWLRRASLDSVPCVLPGASVCVEVPLRDFYESYWFFSEADEGRQELAFFLERITPGDVIYDIGGFRGAYGAAAKAVFGDAVEVYIFEPIARNQRAIETISRLNKFDRFHLVPYAVGCGPTVKGVFNGVDQMLRDGDTSENASTMEIPATALDAFAEKSGRPPSIIKIDVDGFELQVLQGGRACLERDHPRIWIELHPNFLAAQGRKWEEALEILKSYGYQKMTFYRDREFETRNVSFHVWCES